MISTATYFENELQRLSSDDLRKLHEVTNSRAR